MEKNNFMQDEIKPTSGQIEHQKQTGILKLDRYEFQMFDSMIKKIILVKSSLR